MTTMNVSIPDSMKQWVEQQASSGRYANASDYVRHLIRSDQERTAKIAHIQASSKWSTIMTCWRERSSSW